MAPCIGCGTTAEAVKQPEVHGFDTGVCLSCGADIRAVPTTSVNSGLGLRERESRSPFRCRAGR